MLILTHYAATVTTQEKEFFDFIDKQLILNRIFPDQYAVIMDKYSWVKNNVTTYGQLIGGGDKIVNIDKVDEIRKKIGLNTLREFYEIMNIKLPDNYK